MQSVLNPFLRPASAIFSDAQHVISAKFANRDSSAMQELVERCAKLHLDHIASSGDPFEFGSARPLDFGHWSAHKLEMITDAGIRHGEAVGIGILLDSFYAVKSEC